MNTKFFQFALGLAITAVSINANAQKTYSEGAAIYTVSTSMGDAESKVLFKGDSSIVSTQQGPATVQLIANGKGTYFAILVDVPVASIKKAAVLTPDELDQAQAAAPKFTYTPTTETKQISGFNCKKVTAVDTKTKTSYDIWVTNDITAPKNSIDNYVSGAGGFPVQFATVQQGQTVNVILKSISDQKVPNGSFGIPAGFDRISLDELKAMSGR